jgi:thiol-disulfide isomerase/thioredoxin
MTVALAATACGGDDAQNLPALELPALPEGPVLETGTLHGPAVINLWAVWCVPCTEELPDFQRASDDLAEVRFLGIDETGFGEDERSVEFLADLGITYDQYVDPDGALSSELEVTELPATLIVDDEGAIVWLHQGQVTYDELVERLRDL